jgi:hypothetical protein
MENTLLIGLAMCDTLSLNDTRGIETRDKKFHTSTESH